MGYVIKNCKNGKGYYILTGDAGRYLTKKLIDLLNEEYDMEGGIL